MGKISDDEIRQIVQKATLLQKFGEQPSSDQDVGNEDLNALYEITDDIGIPRRFVYEAFVEQNGIPVQEPIVVDNHDFNSTEIVGFASGNINKELFNELKGQIEYHFNTLGTVTRRRDKIVWKAKPVGPSKFIASSNSPEVEFEQINGNTKIKVTQSLKTLNKLYIPGMAAAFGGFMLFAGTLFGQTGSDVAPPLIISLLIITAATFFARFVNSRKRKRKKNLQELTETLQGKIERHLKSTVRSNPDVKNSAQIEIPENEYEKHNVEEDFRSKIRE